MCEILAVRLPEPEGVGGVLRWAEKMEHYGLGGFGWGVAWLEGSRVRSYRYPGRLAEDQHAPSALAGVQSSHYLFHFRRPTRLRTTGMEDTQPFVDPSGRFAFCHNGHFTRDLEYRSGYGSRLRGRADSEVGYLMLNDLLAEGLDPAAAVAKVHGTLGGEANFGYLDAAGELFVFNAYPRNRVHRFRTGDAEVAATSLHSQDDSLFDLVFTESGHRAAAEQLYALHS